VKASEITAGRTVTGNSLRFGWIESREVSGCLSYRITPHGAAEVRKALAMTW